MSLESKQETTDEVLLGTDLGQNARRLYQEGKGILTESKRFLEALGSESFVNLRQPKRIEGAGFVYIIFSAQDRKHSHLLITKISSIGKEKHYSTLFTDLPAKKPGKATIQYATYIEGGIEKAKADINTQTAVQKAEEFLKILKQDLP